MGKDIPDTVKMQAGKNDPLLETDLVPSSMSKPAHNFKRPHERRL